jgi:ADP-heptose:LPS heptosyltransferase
MIIISPYAKPLPNGGDNPKNYPYWKQLIPMINDQIVQVGTANETQMVSDFRQNLSLLELKNLVNECDTWIACDSFFQHFCWDLNKPGIVLWGQSDPLIYGHPENVNLLKDRSYLFHNQFLSWDLIPMRYDCFVEPNIVIDALSKFSK